MTRATTKGGQTVNGIRVAEDTFSIVIRDGRGGIHSLDKSDLTKLDKQLSKSAMPAYANLSASDLDDLIAYLFSLRGDL